MTRKEAWRRAKGYLYNVLSGEESDEIIKAIEQDPLEKYIEEIDYLRRYISKLEKQVIEQEQKWIPVSERLPEENKSVIVSTEYGVVYPDARYTKKYGWEWAYEAGADYWQELEDEDVTAWMPLPKPYEPQESEEEYADFTYKEKMV